MTLTQKPSEMIEEIYEHLVGDYVTKIAGKSGGNGPGNPPMIEMKIQAILSYLDKLWEKNHD